MIIKKFSIKTKMICDIRKSTAGTNFFFFLLHYNNFFPQIQMPMGPKVRAPTLQWVKEYGQLCQYLHWTNSGYTLSEVSVILEMYFKREMNYCIMVQSYNFLIFYYTKGTLTWWLKAFNPLIMALLHKFWSLENSMACPLSAKSNNNQTCYY